MRLKTLIWHAVVLGWSLCKVAAVCANQCDLPAGDTKWQSLKIPAGVAINGRGFPPPGGSNSVSDAAIEQGGSLWIMANQSVFYWNGTEFRFPTGPQLYCGQYLTGLYGGSDRPLYATQSIRNSETQGKIFRLGKGTAEHVTEFYYDVAHEYPGIYVTKSGQLLNWGKLFVAVYDGNDWKRQDVAIDQQVAVVETSNEVHLLTGLSVYTIDRQSTIQHRTLNSDTLTKIDTAVLWGENRILAIDKTRRKLAAFELPDFKQIDVSHIHKILGNNWAESCFRAIDGSVWMYHRQAQAYPTIKSMTYRLKPTGEIEEIGDLSGFDWTFTPLSQYPNSVLCTKDGSVWFAIDNQGLVEYKGGSLEQYGWKNGVPIGGARGVFQDEAGNVFAYFHHAILMAPADGRRVPLPPWVSEWDEFPLASYRAIQDNDGNLWMALKNETGKVSRWDGREFLHRPVPFDTRRLRLLIADDQGHLLALTTPEISQSGVYDVGPKGTQAFDNLDAALVAAASRGARSFASNNDVAGPYVDDEGRIWYALPEMNPQVRVYNGMQWSQFRGFRYVHNSTEGILCSSTDAYAKFEKGHLLPINNSERAESIAMYGPLGRHRFEPKVYAQTPGSFLLIDNLQGCVVTPRYNLNALDEPWTFEKGEKRPNHMGEYVTRGRFDSLWSTYCACSLYRMIGGIVIRCEFRDSPLTAQDYISRNLFDDRAGNLWIHRAATWGATNALFMKRVEKFRLISPQLPKTIGKGWVANVKATSASGEQIDPRLIWRINNDPWIRGPEDGKLFLTFNTEGDHRVTVLAVGPQAELCAEPLELKLHVKVIEE